MSMQVLTFPEGFGTTTIPAHHCDGPSILEITVRDSVHLISLFTSFAGKLGLALLLEEHTAWNLALRVPCIQGILLICNSYM